MEENINQLLITLRDSAVGQWWTEHGLWVALLAPLAYVIICCIISNSSEKRVYFYSYLDVFILFIPIITFLALSFFLGIEDNKKLSSNEFNIFLDLFLASQSRESFDDTIYVHWEMDVFIRVLDHFSCQHCFRFSVVSFCRREHEEKKIPKKRII